MHEALLANSHIYDSNSGTWINEKFQRIAEIINDLNPTLRLLWIPDSERQATDLEPYAVAQMRLGLEPYIICYVKEDELDHRLIAKLTEMNSDSLLERLDKIEQARELVEAKEREDKAAELADSARSMWRSPFHHYQKGKGVYLNL